MRFYSLIFYFLTQENKDKKNKNEGTIKIRKINKLGK